MHLKHLILLFAAVGLAFTGSAQNTIYTHAVGNWRNGPVVYISPLVQTTEAATTPDLIARLKAEHPEFQAIEDIDVLRFATMEEGEQSRQVLKSKYLRRGLTVEMFEGPDRDAPEGTTE